MFEALLEEFISESIERLNNVEDIFLNLDEAKEYLRIEFIKKSKREIHTIKGNAGMMGLKDIQELCHIIEDQIETINIKNPDVKIILEGIDKCRTLLLICKKGKKSISEKEVDKIEAHIELSQDSVRVSFNILDELVDYISEIIILRNRLKDVIEKSPLIRISKDSWDEIRNAEEDISKILMLLYNKILNLRMVPLSNLFRQMNRIVHDESLKEQKRIYFSSSGGDTPMDKALFEIASNALGHLIRNAVIHGIELPSERESKGKSQIGNIMLSAQITSNEVIIDIKEDRKGIDK